MVDILRQVSPMAADTLFCFFSSFEINQVLALVFHILPPPVRMSFAILIAEPTRHKVKK